MTHTRLMLVISTLTVVAILRTYVGAADEPNPNIHILGEYLAEMADKLNCYFTIEDRPDAEGGMPWIGYLEDVFTPDLEVVSIDALVTKLNNEVEDVKFVRSTKYPSVVHVIAKDLLVEGYVMDQKVTVQYMGRAADLPRHLGTLLNGKIGPPTFGVIGQGRDITTELEVNVQDETVRDVLTGAIPLDGEYRTLWEAQNWGADDAPARMRVFYHVVIEMESEEGERPE